MTGILKIVASSNFTSLEFDSRKNSEASSPYGRPNIRLYKMSSKELFLKNQQAMNFINEAGGQGLASPISPVNRRPILS